MLHILLVILSVIGKILLVLLGIILLLILLLLFGAFRYGAHVKNEGKEIEAGAYVSWLWIFVKVRVEFIEKQLSYELYLLGIPVLRLLKWLQSKKSGKKPKEKKESRKQEQAEKEIPAAEETAGIPVIEQTNTSETIQSNTETTEITKTTDTTEITGTTEKTETTENTGDKEGTVEGTVEETVEETEVPKESIWAKIGKILRKTGSVLQKILGIPSTVVNKIQGILEKLKGIKLKVDDILEKVKEGVEFLKSDLFKDIFAVVKKELIAMIRHILPRKLWGYIEYGLGDPGTTGEILAVISIFYPVLPEKLVICPNFDELVIKTDLSLKGHIRLGVLAFHAVKILLNKSVRRLIKKIRHKEA